MKNSTRTFFVICLLISHISFAKNKNGNQSIPNNISSKGIGHNNSPYSFAPFFNEDFSGGFPAGWQRIDSTGNGVNWHITNTHVYNGTDSLSHSGTTAANGYMIYNSDSAGGTAGLDKADLITQSISCIGHPNVHLNFNEFLRHYNESAIVYVSIDSTSWTEIHNTSTGLSVYQSTPNPNNVDIDITSIAANQPNVYIRFSYHANYSYYWMIDDVKLFQVASQDASLKDVLSPLTSCSLLSATESISVNILNEGGDVVTNVDVTYSVDGGTPVTENITDSIFVGIPFPYTFTATSDLSAPGTHSITAYITLAGDTNAVNDTVRSVIFNGPHLIDGVNSYSMGFESTEDLFGILAEDANNDTITWAIDSTLGHLSTNCVKITSPLADDWIFTPCFDLDSSASYLLSYYYRKMSTGTQANLQIAIGTQQNSGNMSQLILPNTSIHNVTYKRGDYVFNVPSSGSYFIGFEVSNVDTIAGFCLDDINVSLYNGVGINSLDESMVSIFPNPSTGLIYINSNKIENNGYSVEVLNPVGELISSSETFELSNYQVDLSNYSAGIYILRVVSNSGIITRQITLTK